MEMLRLLGEDLVVFDVWYKEDINVVFLVVVF